MVGLDGFRAKAGWVPGRRSQGQARIPIRRPNLSPPYPSPASCLGHVDTTLPYSARRTRKNRVAFSRFTGVKSISSPVPIKLAPTGVQLGFNSDEAPSTV